MVSWALSFGPELLEHPFVAKRMAARNSRTLN